jgi:O-antigen/teichoic acid export membrane protein
VGLKSEDDSEAENIVIAELFRRRSIVLILPAFFGLKVLLGLLLVKLSAEALTVSAFALFSQFFLFLALLNTVASAGVQNGLIRQIAGAGDEVVARTAFKGAVRIWLSLSAGLILLSLGRGLIATLLVSDKSQGWIVPWLIGTAVVGGLGQIYSAVLIGTGRTGTNVLCQAVGLIASAAGAVVFLLRGEADQSVIAFALGSLLTPLSSWFAVRRSSIVLPGEIRGLATEVRWLLGYSGTFVVVAVLMPSALFGVRYFYRQNFGVDTLSYWLVANRVSDVSTQFLGLFMVQWFLPKITPLVGSPPARKLILSTFVMGSAAMLSFVAVFFLGSKIFVPLLLSKTYVPATPYIVAYMVGDSIRVSASIALYYALARRKLAIYVVIEASSVILFSSITMAGILMGKPEAPLFGYIGAFALLSLILGRLFFKTPRSHVLKPFATSGLDR